MPISIGKHPCSPSFSTYNYDVTIDNFTIETVVTSNNAVVSNWIQATEIIISHNTNKVVIGLDVEWRPPRSSGIQSPVAIIQLCLNNRCLIYQILQSNSKSVDLHSFLKHYTFVGVGIADDAAKLTRDYGLEVPNVVDLRNVAVKWSEDESMKFLGLKRMAKVVLGMEMEKSMHVTMSNWDDLSLNLEQVKYAVADAYVSYKLGTILEAYKYFVQK